MSRARQLADSADLSFDDGTLVVDSANNRVGIGTSSPASPLEVSGVSGNSIIRLEDTTHNQTVDILIDVTKKTEFKGGSSTSAFSFTSGSSGERMRIDGNGNLLVGKTSSSESSVGVELKPSSAIVTRNNDAPLKLRRNTSDGDILQLAKDGTTVGSISSNNNRLQIKSGIGGDLILGTTSDPDAYRFNGTVFYPSVADATVDLGVSNRRFKDLYLSGGVVFGDAGGSGTSTSNTLDNYEEGTWTPVLEGSNTAGTYTYDTARTLGTYTKIGNTVFLSGSLRVSGVTSAGAGDAQISGLPFTPSVANQGSYPRRPHPVLFQSATTLGSSSIFASIENSLDFIGLRTQSTSTIAAVSVQDADDVDSIWAFSVVYKVS